MKNILLAGLLSATVATSAAYATPISWDFNGNFAAQWGGKTFTSDGHSVTAYAFTTSNTDGSGKFLAAKIAGYSGGLGVRNTLEANEATSPNHATDNSGRDDLIVFEFDDDHYIPTSFMIGWKQTDADIQGWLGGSSVINNWLDKCFGGAGCTSLGSLGFTQFDFNNVGVNTLNNFNTIESGRYLVIAGQRNSGNNDYFKFKNIAAELPNPPTEIPEPTTLTLTMIAVAGLATARRKKQQQK